MALTIQEERRHLDNLRRRQSARLEETERSGVLSLGAPEIVGVAAILPATQVTIGGDQPMRRDDEVEEAAMEKARIYEEERGWRVTDVSEEGRGFDLLSQGPDGAVRYTEVKGRAGEGRVELTENEWLKAEQLGEDFWLYIVTNALQDAQLHVVWDPAHRLRREDVIPRVRYRVAQQGWLRVAESGESYDA